MNEKEFCKEMLALMPVKISKLKIGITGAEFELLNWIDKSNKEITGVELSKLMGCTKVYISRILFSLDDKGLIQKKSNAEDKRSMLVMLSEKGKTLVFEAHKKHEDNINKLYKTLGEVEAKKFIDSFKLANEILN